MNTLIIAVLNSKGGSGKTTLTTNLARAVQKDGYKVLIVDTDPQGTARDWAAAGEDSGQPPVIGVNNARTLQKDLRDIGASYDAVLIDGSAKLEGMTGACVRSADAILIPVQPSPADIWGTSDVVGLVQQRQEVTDGIPPAAFVVSRQISRTNLADEIQEALEDFRLPVLEGRTTQRVAFAEALISGETVLDVEPGGKAAQEIEAIKDNLYDLLNA